MPRIISIDYGLKRTGLAWTDPLQLIATGLETVPSPQLLPRLQQLCTQEAVEAFVLGYPTRLDGSDTDATGPVRALAEELRRLFPQQQLHLWDERFTSRQALDTMIAAGLSKKRRRDKALVDTVSATLILQDFLAQQKG